MARVSLILHDARVTTQEGRVALLEFANPGDCAIPVGCAPEPEPAPFVDVGLPFFAVNDGYEFPPGNDDESFPDSWPVILGRGQV